MRRRGWEAGAGGSSDILRVGIENGAAAKNDLYGNGYHGGPPNAYQDLISIVNPERRVVVKRCREQHFSILLIVPNDLKANLVRAIQADTSWVRPRLRKFGVV